MRDLWILASRAKTVERIFDVRFSESDVLNVSAEMEQRVVQIISRRADRKFFYGFIEPDARRMVHA